MPVTPVDTLYSHAQELKERGYKVISVEFVMHMIERQRTFYDKADLNGRRDDKDAV